MKNSLETLANVIHPLIERIQVACQFHPWVALHVTWLFFFNFIFISPSFLPSILPPLHFIFLSPSIYPPIHPFFFFFIFLSPSIHLSSFHLPFPIHPSIFFSSSFPHPSSSSSSSSSSLWVWRRWSCACCGCFASSACNKENGRISSFAIESHLMFVHFCATYANIYFKLLPCLFFISSHSLSLSISLSLCVFEKKFRVQQQQNSDFARERERREGSWIVHISLPDFLHSIPSRTS